MPIIFYLTMQGRAVDVLLGRPYKTRTVRSAPPSVGFLSRVSQQKGGANAYRCGFVWWKYPWLVTSHDPTHRSCQKVLKISRIEWGSDQEAFEITRDGTGRVGSGRVGSGKEVFKISRVAERVTTWLDLIRENLWKNLHEIFPRPRAGRGRLS